MMDYLNEILSHFSVEVTIEPYGNGHINDTYLTGSSPRYILQRINTNVFKNPKEVMDNILNVTEHVRKKIIAAGGDPERETLRVIKTKTGENYYEAKNGDCYRMYNYIENSVSYDITETPEQLFQAGRAFGRFQNMLSDFPADKLFETIPDFHDTRKRFENLKNAIKADKAGRAASVKDEIDFALSFEEEVGIVVDALKDGSLPCRVTHNDTKLNNVMFDKETGEAVCVIDLDTVMPGSLLYDYGDALRFGASTGAEDETDLSKIEFSLEYFEAFTNGFLGELGSAITEKECELLAFSAKLITYEIGIRFLTDYLEGDTYFKIHREHHNLDRCRTQFKLVADIEKKTDKMNEIIKKYI